MSFSLLKKFSSYKNVNNNAKNLLKKNETENAENCSSKQGLHYCYPAAINTEKEINACKYAVAVNRVLIIFFLLLITLRKKSMSANTHLPWQGQSGHVDNGLVFP